ncbi:MAG: TonB-dependent receptor plug domain-containing protein [Bacteroidota bacterium]
MIKNLSILSFLIIALVFVINVSAQERIIHGVVTTFDSIVVVGAKIKVKSTKQIVKSDTLGQFSVSVTAKDKLKITAHGFNTTNVKISEKTKIIAVNLKLKPSEKSRAYAIGYGHVLDEEKLNAVVNMSNKDVDFSQYTSMHELIQGRFAGVQVMTNGDIIIRGVNSINSSSAALIVVDGVPVDKSILYSLPPIQVKSINVLKDGSSAIYGSRGANGVVIIETKSGGDD